MIDELMKRLSELPDVEEAPSQWNARPAFWIDGREFVHFQTDDEIEVRLTRKLINELDDARVTRRTRTSDWVVVGIGESDLVVDLAKRALDANRRG
jgi:glucose-6-phosphate isomerase